MATGSPLIDPKLVYLKTNGQDPIPDSFEYPHFYTPIGIAKKSAKDLQTRLQQHLPEMVNQPTGHMLGVLVVQTKDGELGYLSAYSGELQPELEILPFVPPVYQLSKGEDFPEMAAINAISKEINELEKSKQFISTKQHLTKTLKETKENIITAKKEAKQRKAERDRLRKESIHLPEKERQELFEKLTEQGTNDGMDLRRFTRSENLRLEKVTAAYVEFEERIESLKTLRKTKSNELQDSIFTSYIFLNGEGEGKNVKKVFTDFGVEEPPAGAGECAAPKLFQYAFKEGMTPVALAEFWWGPSPNSEIREHGKFYPACKGKCQPILAHMLKGISVKPNPLLENFAAEKQLEILFEDEHLVVVNKPTGMLSVPGRYIKDSVKTRILEQYPEANGPIIVHRLDQDTSGIMIVTLSKKANKLLQQQFLERTIHKTYFAVLEKPIEEIKGVIDLPLILDINNRPMQMVSYEHGKPALTHYEVIKKTASQTLIKLNPITGRSHQLRVHCAHKLGLHIPMVGDNLYGTPSDRLYLHAQQVEFTHPMTKEQMKISTELPFDI
ncbi:RluA family pseudouridine synthase [Flagellimonas zhangzhouensis]|uniref:tRNA pseudouridine32 synthase / 23S rRNA pseudouridine746 synthase n=1 Tax=Flagellimonas zhangzhouensis TaxID=1073328 RepID=A0A1H2U5P2_9FLAO|nr:RluA family pseudouridine synthase [Allomuricauda zhangzhouensis]SDQ19963.1 tRNA pseudouridine32 synthase / 23S rRNA pseudouridine746 synthase [Allomuricauda zhangzhouensis]SDW51552.1 tRNA pseudouridine32 synthase / 23S rRNA pseudouridine746 synthase [Allomuricauda zhangzhouensis]